VEFKSQVSHLSRQLSHVSLRHGSGSEVGANGIFGIMSSKFHLDSDHNPGHLSGEEEETGPQPDEQPAPNRRIYSTVDDHDNAGELLESPEEIERREFRERKKTTIRVTPLLTPIAEDRQTDPYGMYIEYPLTYHTTLPYTC
jgi:hypothetical protein